MRSRLQLLFSETVRSCCHFFSVTEHSAALPGLSIHTTIASSANFVFTVGSWFHVGVACDADGWFSFSGRGVSGRLTLNLARRHPECRRDPLERLNLIYAEVLSGNRKCQGLESSMRQSGDSSTLGSIHYGELFFLPLATGCPCLGEFFAESTIDRHLATFVRIIFGGKGL